MDIISGATYNKIIFFINNYTGSSWDLDNVISSEFNIPLKTAGSIVANNFTKHTRYTYGRQKKNASTIYERYKNATERGEPVGKILRIANEMGASSHLIGKLVVEQDALEKQKRRAEVKESPRKNPSSDHDSSRNSSHTVEEVAVEYEASSQNRASVLALLRDSSLIQDGHLAFEIMMSSVHDRFYGPISDFHNRVFGREYEIRLRNEATKAGLSFLTETELRTCGYDKTPDLKLNVPVALDGFIINWIESKALFADDPLHKDYISSQYSSYWNRFGPGLVIYWLGFVESVADPSEKRFLVRSSLPLNLVHMNPFKIASAFSAVLHEPQPVTPEKMNGSAS